ncbi:MAG: PDZ domain-containing protein, partial [bacterium]
DKQQILDEWEKKQGYKSKIQDLKNKARSYTTSSSFKEYGPHGFGYEYIPISPQKYELYFTGTSQWTPVDIRRHLIYYCAFFSNKKGYDKFSIENAKTIKLTRTKLVPNMTKGEIISEYENKKGKASDVGFMEGLAATAKAVSAVEGGLDEAGDQKKLGEALDTFDKSDEVAKAKRKVMQQEVDMNKVKKKHFIARVRLFLGEKKQSNDVNFVGNAPFILKDLGQPFLGIKTKPIHGASGPVISAIATNSPASESDLQHGDVILSINGKKIESEDDYHKIVNNQPLEGTMKFTVDRMNEKKTINVPIQYRMKPQ